MSECEPPQAKLTEGQMVLKLSTQTVCFSIHGIPVVGNLKTGSVIGLTAEGRDTCALMAKRNVPYEELPLSCKELAKHLRDGGYLEEGAVTASEIPPIQSAYLHVTQRCNLSCRFCYSKRSDRNVLPDPPLEGLYAAIDFLATLGVGHLVISGGEPFLRPGLQEIVSHAKSSNIKNVIILTNGLLINPSVVRPLAKLVDCIAVAFDGISAESEAFLRNRQHFSSLAQAIRTIQQEDIEARILPTIHGRNVDDIEHYERLAKELGATVSYSLLLASPQDGGAFMLSDAQLARLGELSSQGAFSYSSDAYTSEAVALSVRHFCGAGTRTLSIAADGSIYPCHMLHDERFCMGNAFTDTPESVMGGKVAQDFRQLDVRHLGRCKTCETKYLCGGGCRARALLHEKSIIGHDPYCRLYHTYYRCLGRQLASYLRKEDKDAV